MIEIGKTKVSDLLDNMSQIEILEYANNDSEGYKYGTIDYSKKRLEGFKPLKLEATASYEVDELNGYDVYFICGDFIMAYVIVKSNKLVSVLYDSDAMGITVFEGNIVLVGHDTYSAFSTLTGKKHTRSIR